MAYSGYGTVDGADTYHTAQGNTAWTGATELKEQAMTRGTAYIDGRYRYQRSSGTWLSMFRGVKTGGRAQSLEQPRTGQTDYEGNEIPDDEVPTECEIATYEAGLRELVTPGSLSPDYVPAEEVKREKVGPLETEFRDRPAPDNKTPTRPVIPAIDEILAPLLMRPYDLPAGFVV